MRTVSIAAAITAPFVSLVLLTAGQPVAALSMFILGGVFAMTPVLRPNVQWLGPVVTRFETNVKELWLTIDDGPAPDTGEILDLLDRLGVRATFFMKGGLATPETVRAVVGRGHSIGNHTQTHPSATFWCLPPSQIRKEIDDAAKSLAVPTPLFRAPVGMKNWFVHPILASRGLHLVGFSARAFDAVVSDPRGVARAIGRRIAPGAIVVLHQGRPWSAETIRETVELCHEQGYRFTLPDAATFRC